MPKLISEKNQLQQLSLNSNGGVVYQPARGFFKVVYQGLILPNLPAPLRYFNYISLIGQPRIPLCYNANGIVTSAVDTATVLVSNSLHSVGHLKTYSIRRQCQLNPSRYQFDKTDLIEWQIPRVQLRRIDYEMSCDLIVQTPSDISNSSALQWGISDYWSILCHCEGEILYKGQKYEVNGLGRFKHARALHLPFLSLCFYTCQIINLNETTQVTLSQIRNQWNIILFSRLDIQELGKQPVTFTEDVNFHIHRVYPKVETPHGREMYLPREFSWQCKKNGKVIFELYGESRGDYKFGLAAGYIGSFRYQLSWNDQCLQGEGGYCEYIDCRPLRWQEKNQNEKMLDKLLLLQPCLYKK
ncbi:hypothetical protein APC04_01595 [Acinetobacter baumannii]|nr:hypothetical protein APC04_01595 [Acinetobacter baumannii]